MIWFPVDEIPMQAETGLCESLIQEYGVNVDATRPAKLRSPLADGVRIFQVEHSSSDAYIIDTPYIRQIACHPHVVGNELESMMFQSAELTLPAILELCEINKSNCELLFEQILRAAPGYQLHAAAARMIPGSFRTVFIRPRYTHTSYRDHDGMVQQQLEVVYEDFSDLQRGKDIVLFMQDTVASSRSAVISIERAIKKCEESGTRIKKWVLYGFIALSGLELLEKVARNHDIPLRTFALGNLAALCANNYDMPLFGVDEYLWQKQQSIHKLGGLVDRVTFADYVKEFIPGADQPGDWSARQTNLFNGSGFERGDIEIHLKNSVRLIKSLLEIGTFSDLQRQIAFTELQKLNEKLVSVPTSLQR